MKERELMICRYIKAYNHFDIDAMLADFDTSFTFENVTGGNIDLSLEGIPAFKEQAEKTARCYKKRHQKVTSFMHYETHTEVDIAWSAILAVDLPCGLSKGDELHLAGRSVFRFSDDKIAAITDIS